MTILNKSKPYGVIFLGWQRYYGQTKKGQYSTDLLQVAKGGIEPPTSGL